MTNKVALSPREGLFRPFSSDAFTGASVNVSLAFSIDSVTRLLTPDEVKDIFYFCYTKPDNTFGIQNPPPVDLTKDAIIPHNSFRGACAGSGVNYIFYDYFYGIGLKGNSDSFTMEELSYKPNILKNDFVPHEAQHLPNIINTRPNVQVASININLNGALELKTSTTPITQQARASITSIIANSNQNNSIQSDMVATDFNPWNRSIGMFFLNPHENLSLTLHAVSILN